jgi:2-(1,2-epoxy-1,2-dihydrophenyl)acetyl-CoA isomerase
MEGAMKYETIILEKHGAVTVLTLNRSERMNAVNGRMFQKLKVALDEVAQDEGSRILVLTGSGRAFCADLDLKEDRLERHGLGRVPTLKDTRQFIRQNPQVISKQMRSFPKPCIAMVNGSALADGMDWALLCDIRIGSENARFMNAFVRMGLCPNTGGAPSSIRGL